MKEDIIPLVIDKIMNTVLSTGVTSKEAINKIVDEIAGGHLMRKDTIKLIKQRVNGIIGNEAAVRGAGQISKEIAKLKTVPQNGFAGDIAKLAKKDLNALNASARAHERVAKRAGALLEKSPAVRPGSLAKMSARGGPKALQATSMLDDILKGVVKHNGKTIKLFGPEWAAKAAQSVDFPTTKGARLALDAAERSGLFGLKSGLSAIKAAGRAIPDIIKTPPSLFSKLSEKPAAEAIKAATESTGKELIKYVPKEATKEAAKDSRKLLHIGKFAAKHKGKLALLGITGAALANFFLGNNEVPAEENKVDAEILFRDSKLAEDVRKLIGKLEEI